MNQRHSPFAFLGIVIVMIGVAISANLAGFGFAQMDQRDLELAEAIDRLSRAQDELAWRLRRIEDGAPSHDRNRSAAAAPARAGVETPAADALLSPAEMIAARDEAIRKLEDRLVSEPVSPQWARSNERHIEQFLGKDSMTKRNLPAPTRVTSTCHSKTCRIGMVFADELQAQQTSASLYREIAETLPSAQTFLIPRADGSTQLLVFAGAAQP